MRITLFPLRADDALSVSRTGDILTINGEAFDFSSMPEGATIPAGAVPCRWITGPVERIDGQLRLGLFLPHGSNPSAVVAFPAQIIDPPDGPIDLPRDPDPEVEESDHVES